MEIQDMDSAMGILRDLFQSAKKKETVRIFSKSGGRHEDHQVRWLLQEGNLRKALARFPGEDLYISFNTFKNSGEKAGKPGRASRDALFNVYNFCIDVDYKAGRDRDVPVRDAVAAVWELFGQPFGNEIPMPAYIEYGNQFRLIYCLEGHLSSERQWGAIELVARKIVQALNDYEDFDFHAETQPLTSYIRFPGSVNAKDKRHAPAVRFIKTFLSKDGCEIDIPARRTLGEYMDIVLGEWERPDWYEQWKKAEKRSGKAPAASKRRARSLKELNHSRMEDIVKIRNHVIQHGEVGYRDKLCFAYFIHAKQYFECPGEALQALRRFNAGFSLPLSDAGLKNCVCTALRKDYRMRSARLLEFLGITEDLAAALRLDLATSASSNAECCRRHRRKKKKARKRTGMLRSQKTARIKNAIVAMRKKGCRTESIMHALGLSRKSAERYITILIKEGRILKMKVARKCQDIIESRKESSGQEFLQAFASAVILAGKTYAASGKSEQEWVYELSLFDKACRASGMEGGPWECLPNHGYRSISYGTACSRP